MVTPRVIAAIDPSIAAAGWCVLTGQAITLFGHGPLRACAQIEALGDVLAAYRPDVVAIESTFISVNAKTGIDLAELRGRLRQALETRGLTIELISPATWRKTTIKPPPRCKRKELKALAREYVRARFGVAATDDEADAISLAVHCLQTRPQS